MVEPHEGFIELRCTFDEAWSFLRREGEIRIQTSAGTPFTARADITKRGQHAGRRVIRFLQKEREYARSYECCWGHYYNCNRTRIGMYCRALDNLVP